MTCAVGANFCSGYSFPCRNEAGDARIHPSPRLGELSPLLGVRGRGTEGHLGAESGGCGHTGSPGKELQGEMVSGTEEREQGSRVFLRLADEVSWSVTAQEGFSCGMDGGGSHPGSAFLSPSCFPIISPPWPDHSHAWHSVAGGVIAISAFP